MNIEGGTATVNTGAYITSINSTNSTVTLNAPAIATASDQTYTINAIISKYIDGVTTSSYRAGVNTPIPVISHNLISCSLARLRIQPLPAKMMGLFAC